MSLSLLGDFVAAGRDEQPRSLRSADPAASGTTRTSSNPALGQHALDRDRPKTRARRGPSAGGSSRDRAAACRRRSSRPPGLSTRATSASAAAGLGHVVQHQHQRRGVEPRIVDRQRLELAAPQVDVVERRAAACAPPAASPPTRRPRSTRATNGASAALTWPVPQPRSPTTQSASASAGERGEMEPVAEQLVAQPIPLAGRRREELLRLGAPLGQRAPGAAADPAPRPASARPARARAARAAARTASSSSRVIVYRLLVPSARDVTQPPSASALRCRLTVDCGSCRIAHSSETVSSWRSSSSRMRLRVVSASDARWSRMAGRGPLIRLSGLNDSNARRVKRRSEARQDGRTVDSDVSGESDRLTPVSRKRRLAEVGRFEPTPWHHECDA